MATREDELKLGATQKEQIFQSLRWLTQQIERALSNLASITHT